MNNEHSPRQVVNLSFKTRVKSKYFYRKFVETLNGFLQLGNRELDILAILVELDVEWPERFAEKNVIDTWARHKIIKETLVNKNNLSRYISNLKKKGILVNKSNDKWAINSNLIGGLRIDSDEIGITYITQKEVDNEQV